MIQLAKRLIRPFYHWVRRLLRDGSIATGIRKLILKLRERRNEWLWRKKGCPVPPPASFKRRFLRDLAKKNRLKIFVETGTLHGDTLDVLKDAFVELYSVELDGELFLKAQSRFRNSNKIRLRNGDSGEELSKILADIRQPALFWLDAHYSGKGTARGSEDTPILQELSALARHSLQYEHIVVIDDARDFNGTDGYPTVEQVRSYASAMGLNSCCVSFDMVVLKRESPPEQAVHGTVAAEVTLGNPTHLG